MRHLFVGAIFTTIATVTTAQTVTVQSGEHPDFTRLVFLFRDKVDWSLEQNENGYSFSVNRPEIEYNLDNVFYFIPRTRINDLYPVNGSSSLDIQTPDDIELTAFELASGEVVVDARKSMAPQPSARAPASPPQIEINPSSPRVASTPPTSTAIALSDPAVYWRLSDQLSLGKANSALTAPAQEEATPQADTSVESALALDQLLNDDDDRVSEAEEQLLKQLSRAASQGLIKLEMPQAPPPEPMAAPAEAPAPEPTRQNEHIAIHSETVIDRDAGSLQSAFDDALGDKRCAPNSSFALREWSEEGDPFALISNLRRSLIGEFDKPDETVALRLAQIYIALGFGAEAEAIVENFSVDDDAQNVIHLMAGIVDGKPVAQNNPLLSMSTCDGSVAFWALLGQNTSDPLEINMKAIQRTYSDLPISLRRSLGVPLANKLIALGYPGEAETVRFSLGRGEENKSLQAVMLDATIDSERETANALEQRLKPVVERDNDDSVGATLMIAEAAFRDHYAMDELVLENASALAIELLPSEDGAKLLRADALGRASRDDWNGAMLTLARWPDDQQPEMKKKTEEEILQRAIRELDDKEMLIFFFQHKPEIEAANLTLDDHQHMAGRLVDLGLPDSVQTLLENERPLSDPSRILMAKAALLEHDGPAAMTYVDGIDTEEAQQIRLQAQNYFLGGDTLNEGGGVPQLSDAGPDNALRRQDWETLATSGSEPEKAFVQAFGLTGSTSEAAPQGELSNAQRLLDRSAEERDALNNLLESLNAR
ncbi:hypothetical protein [Thioclava sp. GXIMD2076]|uniref:hypothetical protein n=1 Tax=Thioclava sp. GXIMD2076 TaxID=3131931 RepID=UPI0030CD80CF